MITGFVLFRSGYFNSSQTSEALHVSPNGGELHLAQVEQEQNKSQSDEVKQKEDKEPIMPSSKSISPVFDLDEIDEEDLKTLVLPSSKSMIYPIEIKPGATANEIENEKREAFKKQPELEKDTAEEVTQEPTSEKETESVDKGSEETSSSETESTHINWRGIWIGVLGILFVALGSIVYFKRRAK